MLPERPLAIALVDGLFDTTPSPWQREILAALDAVGARGGRRGAGFLHPLGTRNQKRPGVSVDRATPRDRDAVGVTGVKEELVPVERRTRDMLACECADVVGAIGAAEAPATATPNVSATASAALPARGPRLRDNVDTPESQGAIYKSQ